MNSLHEQYRPRSFADVVGQPRAVRQIQAVMARGWGGRAWWITGASGTGKTTLAKLIAQAGADEYATEELDAQILTPARVRELEYEMRTLALGAKPGRAYLVNEAHGLRRDTIRLLLVLLERLPRHVVIIFTTTKEGQASLFDDDATGDASPLLSRCTEIVLAHDAKAQAAFAARAQEIATAEGIDGVPATVYQAAALKARGNMRALLQRIESGAFVDDAREALETELAALKVAVTPAAQARRKELQAAIAALS